MTILLVALFALVVLVESLWVLTLVCGRPEPEPLPPPERGPAPCQAIPHLQTVNFSDFFGMLVSMGLVTRHTL